jgi:DNA polymerase V
MIALIDCNNFYCSCERVFNPSLAKKPVIVLSNNDGCAIARSEEAKAIGIQMAQPAFMINDLIKRHKVQVFSSNYTLYGDMSERVMSIIKEFVPKVEVYSIDEIFADLSNFKYHDLKKLCGAIRQTVMQYTGIPITIGIAPTKALAKLANRYAKKNKPKEGVHYVNSQECVEQLLCSASIGDIWGIGKQHETFLKKHSIHTAKDLIKVPEEWIRKNMSVVGQRLVNELKGVNCIQWEEQKPVRKNICTSRSFGTLIKTKKEVKQAVAKFTASCAEKLRREKTCARKLEVFVQTNPHRPEDPQYYQSITLEFTVPTNATTELMKYSMKGLEMIFQPGYNYQKAGVVVLDLISDQQIQLGLFDTQDRERDNRLMKSLDKVNKDFGKDIVRFGVQDYGKDWWLRQRKLSRCYTTKLDQIPEVKAY